MRAHTHTQTHMCSTCACRASRHGGVANLVRNREPCERARASSEVYFYVYHILLLGGTIHVYCGKVKGTLRQPASQRRDLKYVVAYTCCMCFIATHTRVIHMIAGVRDACTRNVEMDWRELRLRRCGHNIISTFCRGVIMLCVRERVSFVTHYAIAVAAIPNGDNSISDTSTSPNNRLHIRRLTVC